MKMQMPKQNKKGFPKKASNVVKSLISLMVSFSLSIRPVNAQGYGRSNSENNAIFRTLSATEKKRILETEIIVIPETNKNSESFGNVEESKKLPFKVFKGNKEIDLTTLKNKLHKKSPDIGKGRILGENIVDYTDTFSKLLKNELESVIEQKVYQNIEEEAKLQLIQKNDFELLQKERFYANVEKAKTRIQEYKLQLVQDRNVTKDLNRDLVKEVNQAMDSKVMEDLYDEINNVRFYNDLLKLDKLLIVGGFISITNQFILGKLLNEKDKKITKNNKETFSTTIINNFFFLFKMLKTHYPKVIVILILTALMYPNVRSFIITRTSELAVVDKAFEHFNNLTKIIQKVQDQTFQYGKSMYEYFPKWGASSYREQKEALKVAEKKIEELTNELLTFKVNSQFNKERLETCRTELTGVYRETQKLKLRHDDMINSLTNELSFIKSQFLEDDE
jgi:hypothetical protein